MKIKKIIHWCGRKINSDKYYLCNIPNIEMYSEGMIVDRLNSYKPKYIEVIYLVDYKLKLVYVKGKSK